MCTILLFSNAEAKSAKASQKIPPVPAPIASVEYNPSGSHEAGKKGKESARHLAEADSDVTALEASFPADFITIRSELIGDGKDKKGVTTVVEFEALINTYSDSAKYKSLSPQAQLVALQLRALKPFKSFIFRAKEYIKKHSVTRAMIVSVLRTQIAGIDMFYPTEDEMAAGQKSNSTSSNANLANQWELVFKYITEPSPDMGFPIETDEALRAFLAGLVNDSIAINNDLNALVVAEKPIWWDNKIYMAQANFTSEKDDRYVMLGAPELNAIYAASSLTISGLESSVAYTFNGLQESTKAIAELYGFDVVGKTPSLDSLVSGVNLLMMGGQGISSYSRIKMLNKHTNFTLDEKYGRARMTDAYRLLVASARAAKTSFERAKNLSDSDRNLFNARVANGFGRLGGMSLDNIVGLVETDNGTAASAVINGARIRVSLKDFYYNSPKNLSDLYPQDWDLSKETIPGKAWNGEDVPVRNYKYGMATKWKLEPYKKLFPDISATKGDDQLTAEVPKFARVLAQTWGSSVFAIPLGAVIF